MIRWPRGDRTPGVHRGRATFAAGEGGPLKLAGELGHSDRRRFTGLPRTATGARPDRHAATALDCGVAA